MNKNHNLADLELTLGQLNESLRVMVSGDGSVSLYIGNEYDRSVDEVFLEDISQVHNKELIERLGELTKVVSESHTEIKRLAIKVVL